MRFLSFAVHDRTIQRRGRRHRPAGGRLPAGPVHRARLLPGHQAGQADPGRGAGRSGQDRARQGARAVPRPHPHPPAVLRGPRRGQGALRVELPQAAAAHPGRGRGRRLAGGPGRHLRRRVPAPAPADGGDRGRGARRPAHRRDRQDRPGVRGDAARAAERLPALDPRARPLRGQDAPGGAADLQQLARADRGAQAPLPVPVARLPLARARARDRQAPRPRARRRGGAQARRGHRHDPRARPQEAALDRGVDRLGARAAAARRRRHRRAGLHRDDVDHRQAPHRPRRGGRARRDEAGAPSHATPAG